MHTSKFKVARSCTCASCTHNRSVYGAVWVCEELGELITGLMGRDPAAQGDAILDTLGIVLEMLLHLSETVDMHAALTAYTKAQTDRGRDLAMYHHLVIKRAVDMLAQLPGEDVAARDAWLEKARIMLDRRGATPLTRGKLTALAVTGTAVELVSQLGAPPPRPEPAAAASAWEAFLGNSERARAAKREGTPPWVCLTCGAHVDRCRCPD